MSAIAWPTGLLPRDFLLTLHINQRVYSSSMGGSEQAVDYLNDRWMASLSLPREVHATSAAVEAFLFSLRGMVNTTALWHFARTAPRGTLRNTPTIHTDAAAGAASIIVQAAAGETLKAGDMLGAGGLLLMVAEDCTANGSGVITVPLVNRLRTALAAAAAVTWDKPTAPFRLVGTSGVRYQPGVTDAVTLEFVEAIS